jgi:predicted nucleic acid-binding protein
MNRQKSERIVCDTGPIIALTLIRRLDLLQSLFSSVIVPEAVHLEITEGGCSQIGVALYESASWIIRSNLAEPPDPLLTSILDEGEASVIQLARELGTDRVLIDERKARKIARNVFGLQVIGSAGILVQSKRNGLTIDVGLALRKMSDAGYRLHEDIITAAMSAAGEL